MSGPRASVAAGMPAVVVATAFGGPEVLSVTDQQTAAHGPGEARIEVRAASVNPIDWRTYSGAMGADPARLPIRLGSEAAGVVTAAGPGAVGPAGPVVPGDEVIAFRVSGAYAAELVVPAHALVPKPSALDWPQAAGLMVTGAAAWHVLAATGVGAGDMVLIHGAAGGVGLMAVQLATARGATVVATGSPARHDFLPGLGAIPVAYGDGLAERGRGGAQAGIKVLGGGPGADPGTEIRAAARRELARLAQDGTLRVFVAQTFPLTDAAAAHRASMTGHTPGKIALIP